MNISWYTKNHNASGWIHNSYFILFFFFFQRLFLIITRLWFIGAAIIFVNYTVCGHDYDIMIIFFYIQSRDNWVTLFYSLLFHWYLLKKVHDYLKKKNVCEKTEQLRLTVNKMKAKKINSDILQLFFIPWISISHSQSTNSV